MSVVAIQKHRSLILDIVPVQKGPRALLFLFRPRHPFRLDTVAPTKSLSPSRSLSSHDLSPLTISLLSRFARMSCNLADGNGRPVSVALSSVLINRGERRRNTGEPGRIIEGRYQVCFR